MWLCFPPDLNGLVVAASGNAPTALQTREKNNAAQCRSMSSFDLPGGKKLPLNGVDIQNLMIDQSGGLYRERD